MVKHKGPKPLSSSLRGRRRYITYQVISKEKILLEDIINTIWHSVLNFLGEKGTAESNLWVIKNSYDEKKKMGLIRCSHKNVEQIRAALAFIQRIGDVRVIIRVLGISGTVKASKKKFFGETSLTEFTR